MWADNADGLSIPYSGTGALKTDFTRTGHRTRIGLVHDFNNSAIRYLKNNYSDGSRQDGIDLILGKYQVHAGISSSPFKATPTTMMIKSVPLVCVSAISIFFLVLISPELFGIESSLLQTFCISVVLTVIVVCWLFIQQNGTEFVDWPKLLPAAQKHHVDDEAKSNVFQIDTVHHKATDLVRKWANRRDSTSQLNEAEEGYELLPTTLKKTT